MKNVSSLIVLLFLLSFSGLQAVSSSHNSMVFAAMNESTGQVEVVIFNCPPPCKTAPNSIDGSLIIPDFEFLQLKGQTVDLFLSGPKQSTITLSIDNPILNFSFPVSEAGTYKVTALGNGINAYRKVEI